MKAIEEVAKECCSDSKVMEEQNRFNIDFFEFSFLVEACIPPRPIARAMFWDRVINYYYSILTQDERDRLYEWVGRNGIFQKGVAEKNEDCLLFEARYNPDNQYLVTTNYEGSIVKHECFKYNDAYCTSTKVSIQKRYIVSVEKL